MSDNTTADAMVGRLLDGRYRISSRIARGGMATVYLAKDLRLERQVAVKIMHGHLADDAAFRERFIREARSAARLAHPNVVAVFDQGEDGGMAYLVMEYLPGITLRELLHEHRILTTEQAFDIIEAVLGGLAAAHRAGIVHRDLKPENILLADDGRIKIGDFGLARAVSANTATGAALLGTIAYLSPELVTRGVADARSDIYAVGIIMYEMLTGEQPYQGDQPVQIAYQHANSSVPAPSAKNPRVPAELDEIVQWATARRPEDRPADATALLNQVLDAHSALQTALSDTGSDTGQRTRVLPLSRAARTGDTTVFAPDAQATTVLGSGGRGAAPTAGTVSVNTAALAVRADRRRGRGWVLLALLVALTVGAGFAGWWFGFGPGARTPVPEIAAGVEVALAESVLTDAGFVVGEQLTEHSMDVAAGYVLRTDPVAGTALLAGEPVRLVISLGPPIIAMPGVVGATQEEALAALADFVVDPANVLRVFLDGVEAGRVADVRLASDGASVAEGTELAAGTALALVVSAGPPPALVGLVESDAIATITNAGLVPGTRSEAWSDDVASGAIISTTITGDGSTAVGQAIDYVVSKGREPVEVPDVLGWTINEAAAEFEARGLVLDASTVRDDARDLVKVDELSTSPGDTVPKGSTVYVTKTRLF